MDRAPWILAQRKRCAERYDELLAGRDWLQLPWAPPDTTHGYQSYVCLFAPREPSLKSVEVLNATRNLMMDFLEERGISTRQGTHAAALQGYYVRRYGYGPKQFPNAYLAEQLSIALPLFPRMTDDELAFVVESLDEAFAASWHR